MNTFRVATLNIWNRLGPWSGRLTAIRSGLDALAPELLGLQEVVRLDPEDGDGLDQAAAISEGHAYHVAYGRAHDERWLGNAALSRWPLARSEVFELPRGGTHERRTLVYAEVDAPFGRIPFFVTHLNWKFDEGHVREAQVVEIALRVEAIVAEIGPGGFPAILVGDFNAESDSDEIRFLRGQTSLGGRRRVYFRDAFATAGDGSPGATFSRANPFAAMLGEPNRRIDYIFVHGHSEQARGEIVNAAVCFDEPVGGTLPSDHFGVVATLRV